MKLVYWAIGQIAKLVKVDRLVAWLINWLIDKYGQGSIKILEHIQQATSVALHIVKGDLISDEQVGDALDLLKSWRNGKVDKVTEKKVMEVEPMKKFINMMLLIAFATFTLVPLTGCAGMGMTPSRSNAQTWNIDITESQVYVAGLETKPQTETAEAGKIFLLGGQILSQNEGEESVTATPTLDISPKAKVTIPSAPDKEEISTEDTVPL